MQSQNDASWCSHTPARPTMVDFQSWTENDDLLHQPTRGVAFTWKNGRSGRRHIKRRLDCSLKKNKIRRLDRVVCNQNWLDCCSFISCLTLIKHKSVMLEFNTDNQLFASNLKFLKMQTLRKNCKDFIANCWNNRVGIFKVIEELQILS